MTTTQELPRKQRHYFAVIPSSGIKEDAWMDVTIHPEGITIDDWGVIIEGKSTRPPFITPERLEAEKEFVCLK